MSFEPISKLDGHVAVITGGKGAIGLAQAVTRFPRATASRPSMLTRGPVLADDWLLPR